jgi:ABC-type glutathione transport system ATPase component
MQFWLARNHKMFGSHTFSKQGLNLSGVPGPAIGKGKVSQGNGFDVGGSNAISSPILEATGVTLQYKTEEHLVTAVYRVDFPVFEGDRFILLGPSGCGKSTLLKAVGGFMKPVDGTFLLNRTNRSSRP